MVYATQASGIAGILGMARKVLLVTTVGWTSTARYAGGFAAASWAVDAICPPGAPVSLSRYIDEWHAYRPLRALSSLRRAIDKSAPDLVVACDDRAISHLLRLYARELKTRGEEGWAVKLLRRSFGALENFESMMSRAESMQTASKIGIRTPDTIAVANEAELEACLSQIGLPAVLKVDGSWGGDGVVVARSRDEALRAFRRLRRPASRLRNVARALKRKDAHYFLAAVSPPKQHVSVQKFVAGRSSASAFSCWKGEMTGALYYDVLVADGAIGPPNVIRRVDCPQMAEASRRVAKHFGLSGIFGLDFIRDEAGDVHLIEINPRTTQGGTLAFGEGRDLPSALAASVTQCETSRRVPIPNDVVTFFPREWQRDPASPHLMNGHHDVPWDDPAVLRDCFATVAKEQDAASRLAAQTLLAPDSGHLPVAKPIWRRALSMARS
jgi:hypothetical protein